MAENKSPMVDFIQKSIREIHSELFPDWRPSIIEEGEYGEDCKACESYCSMWLFPTGEDLNYFGGDEVFGKKFDSYNSKYKLWATMGGSNTLYKDIELGIESVYPIRYYRLLMEKIAMGGLENDVYLTCYTSSGGENHRSYPQIIRKAWTGKFL